MRQLFFDECAHAVQGRLKIFLREFVGAVRETVDHFPADLFVVVLVI